MGAKRTKDYKELGAPGETEEGLRRPDGIVGVDKIIRIVLSSVGPMSPYIHEILS